MCTFNKIINKHSALLYTIVLNLVGVFTSCRKKAGESRLLLIFNGTPAGKHTEIVFNVVTRTQCPF